MRKRQAHRGEYSRAILAGTALAGLLAGGYWIGAGWQTPSMRETAFARPPAPPGDNLSTGAIVFMPALGNDCRQNVIDNRTWEVRQGGTVPCNEARAGAHRGPGGAPATRLDIIRDSFRK
jgi:hypothetical protein